MREELELFEKMTVEDCLNSNREELIEQSLERIRSTDPLIKSFISVAEKVQINDGPYKGIPIAIKDNITTKGLKTTCASKNT